MRAHREAIAVAVVVAALIVAPLGQGNYIAYLLCSWLMLAIAAMGLNLTLGYAGRISLAQASFIGIGAYATSIVTLAHYPWVLGMAVGVVLCFLVGCACAGITSPS